MRIDAVAARDFNRIKVEPMTGAIGAEISNVDLRDFDDEVIAEVQQAWLDHKVLFFRGQDLTQGQHVEYGRALGELEVHPFVQHVEKHPEIIVLDSSPQSFLSADTWHSDVTFREAPPLGSVLFGRVIPGWGGDTCFANMELAYDLLDDAVKEQIDGMYAIHSYAKAVVRSHPVTGNRILFINRQFTLGIDGMTADESRPLRRLLVRQAEIPEVQCRFRWEENSIAQWDNRCTQHYAVPDHGGQHRRVERVTLLGDRPF